MRASINIARWSPAYVQQLHKAKTETIYPLSRLLEGDRTCRDTIRPFYMYMTYCELFYHSIDEVTGRLPAYVTPLPVDFRKHWILHCHPGLGDGLLDLLSLLSSGIWFSLSDLHISPYLLKQATLLHWKAYRKNLYDGQDKRYVYSRGGSYPNLGCTISWTDMVRELGEPFALCILIKLSYNPLIVPNRQR